MSGYISLKMLYLMSPCSPIKNYSPLLLLDPLLLNQFIFPLLCLGPSMSPSFINSDNVSLASNSHSSISHIVSSNTGRSVSNSMI